MKSFFRMKQIAAPVCTLLFVVLATGWNPEFVQAKRGDDDQQRTEHRGLVEKRPANSLHGEWVIGNRRFTTGPNTEFDQQEGPLTVGACAKVALRNGAVHEIDSEPMGDCR